MTCTPITPAAFKAAKPQFVAVSDSVTQSYITMAQVWASDWPDDMCATVQTAVTCHLMTLDGLGTDQASLGFAAGVADFDSIKSGQLTITKYRAAAENAGQSTSDWFGQTPCGRQFMVYVRMIKSGPRVAMGGVCGGIVSPYAKDAWWP